MNGISLIRYQHKNLNIYRYFVATEAAAAESAFNLEWTRSNVAKSTFFLMLKITRHCLPSCGPNWMKSNYAGCIRRNRSYRVVCMCGIMYMPEILIEFAVSHFALLVSQSRFNV